MSLKRTAIILLALALLLGSAAPVLAGGDKQRGDVGQGGVEQEHVDWHGYERRP